MTSNQLQYWRNVETERSNRANEKETHRHNVATERLTGWSIAEGARHNRATEFLGMLTLKETNRSNLASEATANFRAMNEKEHYERSDSTNFIKAIGGIMIDAANARTKSYEAQTHRKEYELNKDVRTSQEVRNWVDTATDFISKLFKGTEAKIYGE